jgi:hypothetical protein
MENMLYHNPKHFTPEELIDPVTLHAIRERGLDPWILFRPELLYSLDGVRDYFDKPVRINNWSGASKLYATQMLSKIWLMNPPAGIHSFRGYRPIWYGGGGELSQHRLGSGADFDVDGMTAEEVRSAIILNQINPRLALIRRMESGVSWVHIDVAPSMSEKIILFNK